MVHFAPGGAAVLRVVLSFVRLAIVRSVVDATDLNKECIVVYRSGPLVRNY